MQGCWYSIAEKKTNHSLRATGASALFTAGVPEKLIRDVTGHRSSALQLYERPTAEQRQAVSRVLVQGEKQFSTAESTKNVERSLPSQFNFGGLNNCNVNIYVQPRSTMENSIEQLFEGIDIDEFCKF